MLQTQWGLCRYKSTSQAVQCLDHSSEKWTIWLHFSHERIRKHTLLSEEWHNYWNTIFTELDCAGCGWDSVNSLHSTLYYVVFWIHDHNSVDNTSIFAYCWTVVRQHQGFQFFSHSAPSFPLENRLEMSKNSRVDIAKTDDSNWSRRYSMLCYSMFRNKNWCWGALGLQRWLLFIDW